MPLLINLERIKEKVKKEKQNNFLQSYSIFSAHKKGGKDSISTSFSTLFLVL